MKYIYQIAIFFLLFTYSSLIGQTGCIDPPESKFTGTKVSWVHQIKDTLKEACVGIVYNRDFINVQVKPIIIGDFYIAVYDNNEFGALIHCYNKDDGRVVWENNYNLKNHPLNKGTIYLSINQVSDTTISLIGFESTSTFCCPSTAYAGFTNQLTLDIRDGSVIDFVIVEDFDDRIVGLRPRSIDPVKGSNEFRFFRLSSPFGKDYADVLITQFIDKTTLRRVSPDYQADSIFFRSFLSDGLPPTLNVYGPFITPDYEFITLTRYNLNGTWITEFIKTTDRGKLLERKDISNILVSGLDSWGDIFFDYDDISDGIRLITSHRLSTSTEYHHGYIDLDFDGNMVRDRRRLEIDGNKVGHMRAIDLKGSDDVLICCRFVDSPDNNVHLYRDTKDGQLIKAGEMINNDGKIFAFTPVYIKQDDEGSLYINFDVRVDSAVFDLLRFDFGGWLVTSKIDATVLGTTVSANDVTSSGSMRLSISPNPTTSTAEIRLEHFTDGELTVINLLGQVVHKAVLSQQDRIEIATDAIPPGQYVVMIRSVKGIYRGRMIKM